MKNQLTAIEIRSGHTPAHLPTVFTAAGVIVLPPSGPGVADRAGWEPEELEDMLGEEDYAAYMEGKYEFDVVIPGYRDKTPDELQREADFDSTCRKAAIAVSSAVRQHLPTVTEHMLNPLEDRELMNAIRNYVMKNTTA